MYNDGLDGFFDLSAKKKTLVVPEPWMKNTTLEVIYEDKIPAVIDACIQAGVYGLDTEATGLDTRVFDGVTQDKIVGICLASDIDHGYYIPLRHQKGRNVSWSFMVNQYRRLRASKAVAVMHGAKYDQEILEFDPGMVGQGIRNFDEISTWEDTLLLALLDDSKAKQRGLKMLSETILQRKMIELEDLFPPGSKGRNFSELDPDDPAIGWYAAADAVNTLMLYQYYKPRVFDQPPKQGAVYKIEKACLLSVRWMQRNRLRINLDRVQQLIQLGQDEAFDSLAEVYEGASEILGRDVTPAYFRHLQKHFVRGDPKQTFSDQVDASIHATKFFNQQEKLLKIRDAAGREFPERYDVMSPQQLGVLLEEMKVPGLKYTEKSKQVSTKSKDLDELLEEMGDRMPFLIKIKKFRNVQKAIGTYLVHLWEDTDRRDNTLRVQFKQDGTDTGRFSTPGEKDKADCKRNGTTKFNLHSLPQAGKKGVPECLAKIREVLEALEDEFIVSIDFSGVELRIITNLSREPLWIAEFFRCDGCGKKFDQGDGNSTPPAPPKYCPDCGSDKIGDLHTLTGISIYGADAKNQKDWKQKRGNAKCVHPDTLIWSSKGLVRIGSLGLGDPDTFQPVSGEQIWNGGAYVPLKETYNGGVKPLFHVVTRRGILTCSDQHKFVCADGSLMSIAEGLDKGVPLQETPPPTLPPGRWNLLPFKATDDLPETYIQTSERLAYFAGLFLGDGSKCGRSSVQICHGDVKKTDTLGVAYSHWQRMLQDACEDLGFQATPRTTCVYLGSRSVMRYLEALSLIPGVVGGRILRIPQWVIDSGREGMLHFLGGLLDTDGYVDQRDGTIRWCTKDAIFAGQIASCLSALGMTPSVSPSWNKTYQRDYFVVGVRGSESTAFLGYARHPGKIKRIVTHPSGPMGANQVLKVIPAGDFQCMDLHLDSPDHLYWTSGLLTHNSTNFALSYGGGPSAVQRAAGVDREESYRIKDKFYNTYIVLQGWWQAQKAFVRKHHYVLTPFGRKCPLPDITNPDPKISSKAERNSTNAPVQGFSADITKLAMGAIYQECLKRGWLDKVKMLITIHDELVFAIKRDVVEEAIEVLYEIMTHHRAIQFLKYPVPLTSDVELGINWAVPWNLFEIRANGKWPAELVPYFKEAQKTLHPSERATPAVIPNLVVVLDQQPDQDMAAELRLILQSCQVQGGNPIQVQLPGGVVIDTGYTALRENLRQSLPSRWTLT